MRTASRTASILFASALSALHFAVLAGCAYHPGHGDRQIPGGYRSIAVPVFKNNTPEVGAEVFFTNAFIREMERSRVGVLTEKKTAQAVLEGTIDGIAFIQSEPNPSLIPGAVLNMQYAVNAKVTLRLRRLSDQKILWEGAFSKQQAYRSPKITVAGLTGANALYNHSARYQNMEILAADMMVEAHDRLTENF